LPALRQVKNDPPRLAAPTFDSFGIANGALRFDKSRDHPNKD
jgi:hypothetical protein